MLPILKRKAMMLPTKINVVDKVRFFEKRVIPATMIQSDANV